MNVTDDQLHDTDLSMATKLGFVSWSMINCTMKITLICVCLKTLAKNFHHLSIIWFLVSDVCLSTSTSTFSIIRQTTNKPLCIIILHCIFYFLLLNYCLLFLVCVHRFIILKTKSFNAVKQKFENHKYRIILGTIFIPFLYQLGNTLLMPMNKSIHACSAPALYRRPYQSAFIAVCLVPITICMVVAVILYAVGSHIVWKSYMRVKPAFVQTVRRSQESIGEAAPCPEPQRTFQNENERYPTSVKIDDICVINEDEIASSSCSKNVTPKHGIHDRRRSWDDLSDDDIIYLYSSASNDKKKEPIGIQDELSDDIEDNEHCMSRNTRNTEHRISLDKAKNARCMSHDTNTAEHRKSRDNENTAHRMSRGNMTFGHRLSQVSIQQLAPIRRLTAINQSNSDRSWEIRAFFTCLLIAIQTVLLTGPIIFGFWMDVITSEPLSVQLKFILSFPYLLQGFFNLFIYTWRFNEVRQTFRQICRRQP